MAKFASKDTDLTINSVVMEDDLDNWSLNVTQETPVTTALSDGGPRRVAGNYDWNLDLSGAADFASGESDATLFALLGSAGVTLDLEPTGATAAANDPNYDSASGLMLSSYKLSGAVGGSVQYSCSLVGTAALTRAVA